MKVFINAISIVEGGGYVVLNHLLTEMSNQAPEIEWIVASSQKTLSTLAINNVSKISYPFANKSPFHLLYWYEVVLPKWIKKFKPDVIFSQTNFISIRKLNCPTLLLVQHAGYFSSQFKELHFKWNRGFLNTLLWTQKNYWLRQSIKKTEFLTVQTSSLANKIVKQMGLEKEKIKVIPHGSGKLNLTNQRVKEFPEKGTWRIGYITKFGVQKDFDTAFKAMHFLKKLQIPIKLILTLNSKTKEYKHILKKIDQYNINDIVENYNEVSSIEALIKLYHSLHIFIYPSLCESFGFTLVEAMSMGLPIIISDTESNKEIAGNAGNYFSQKNSYELVKVIYELITQENRYQMASNKSIDRAKNFCWKKTASSMLKLLGEVKGYNASK